MRKMRPQLSKNELKEIVCGAYQAVAAGTLMHNELDQYFHKVKA